MSETLRFTSTRYCRCLRLMIFLATSIGFVSQGHSENADEPISISKWNLTLRENLKQEALSRESPEHAETVIELCEMYAAMRSDDRYESSSVLQGLAARIRRRLLDVRQDIRLSLKRRGIDVSVTGVSESSPSSQRDFSQQVGGGFAPGADNGQMLIELITRTISPEFWSEQGGVGTAYYYGLHRVLVVRATTRVHEDIRALLQALGGLPR